MDQKRITDQKTCGLFVLNVMKVILKVITEICSPHSKKYFQNHNFVLAPLLNIFFTFYQLIGLAQSK